MTTTEEYRVTIENYNGQRVPLGTPTSIGLNMARRRANATPVTLKPRVEKCTVTRSEWTPCGSM